MFEWIARLFRRDRRLIFRFHDGIRWRKCDPLEVTRRLFDPSEAAAGFDIEETPAMLRTRDITHELEAFRLIGIAVREAFEIPPVNRGGLTDMDCWSLLVQITETNGGLKKNGSLFPTSWDSNAGISTNASPTSNGTDSGSTANVPSAVPPTSPPAAA